MSLVLVNDFISTEGEVLVSRSIQERNGKQAIVVEGLYKTKSYIEEIDKIETNNFSLDEVFVVEETFSSETKEITYRFIAEIFLLVEE